MRPIKYKKCCARQAEGRTEPDGEKEIPLLRALAHKCAFCQHTSAETKKTPFGRFPALRQGRQTSPKSGWSFPLLREQAAGAPKFRGRSKAKGSVGNAVICTARGSMIYGEMRVHPQTSVPESGDCFDAKCGICLHGRAEADRIYPVAVWAQKDYLQIKKDGAVEKRDGRQKDIAARVNFV